jgi:hypothetical protein
MGISQSDASAALSDIERATARSQTLRAYSIAGPILMIWGVIWIVGYAGMGLLPGRHWSVLWLGLDALGMVSTFLGLRRGGASTAGASARGWNAMFMSAAAFVFISATFALFRGVSTSAYLVYPGLVCGFLYVLLGLSRMRRLAWIGVGLFAASLGGFYFLQPWIAYWMAAVGGGGLLLGGFWLWKA